MSLTQVRKLVGNDKGYLNGAPFTIARCPPWAAGRAIGGPSSTARAAPTLVQFRSAVAIQTAAGVLSDAAASAPAPRAFRSRKLSGRGPEDEPRSASSWAGDRTPAPAPAAWPAAIRGSRPPAGSSPPPHSRTSASQADNPPAR